MAAVGLVYLRSALEGYAVKGTLTRSRKCCGTLKVENAVAVNNRTHKHTANENLDLKQVSAWLCVFVRWYGLVYAKERNIPYEL